MTTAHTPVLLEFDPQADAIRIRLKPRGAHVRGEQLDEQRIVLYDDAGEPVSIELLAVSTGINLDSLPEAAAIAAALRAFPRLAA